MTTPKIVERMPGGATVWSLPPTSLEILWIGPGGGLFIGRPRMADGPITRIDHHTCSGTFDTLTEASKAVQAFCAAEED